MPRMTFFVLLAALGLSACSDQTQKTPTEPPSAAPSFKTGGPPAPYDCSTTGWLLSDLSAVFPGGKSSLLSSAKDKIGQITTLCKQGNLAGAQTKAFFFLDWMLKKYRQGLLKPNVPQQTSDLGNSVLQGVGIGTTFPPDLVTSDFGTGVIPEPIPGQITPGTTVLTGSGFADLFIPDGAADHPVFDHATLLVIKKLSDGTTLNVPPGQINAQFPPYYDYNAINSNNQHFLNGSYLAVVDVCTYANIDYPFDIQFGHNPVDGTFEILPLDFSQNNVACSEELGSANPGGLQGMAVLAWRAAKHNLASVLLPNELHAASTLQTVKLGGQTHSLSPFGVVEPVPSSSSF
jgi:hypothetical protein